MNEFPDQRANFDFLNDTLNRAQRRRPPLWSQWRRIKQNLPGRYASNIDLFMEGSPDKPGPLFDKGSSFEEMDGYVGMESMWMV